MILQTYGTTRQTNFIRFPYICNIRLRINNMETNMKHYLLALSIGAATLAGCQSPKEQNLVASNFTFAEQQLKYAFPKIDEARASHKKAETKESPGSGASLPTHAIRNRTVLYALYLPKTGRADSSPENFGMYMNTRTNLFGKRKPKSTPKCWSVKRRTVRHTTWDSRCIAATATVTV